MNPHANNSNSPKEAIKLNSSAVDDIEMTGSKVNFSGLTVIGRRG